MFSCFSVSVVYTSSARSMSRDTPGRGLIRGHMTDSDKDPDPAATPGEPIRLLRCQRAITAAPRVTMSLTSFVVSEIKPNTNNIMSETRSLSQFSYVPKSLATCFALCPSTHLLPSPVLCSGQYTLSTCVLEPSAQIPLCTPRLICHAS